MDTNCIPKSVVGTTVRVSEERSDSPPTTDEDPSCSKKRPAPSSSFPEVSSSDADYEASTTPEEGTGSSKSDCTTNEESMSSKSCSTSVSSVSSQNDEVETREKPAKRAKGAKPKKDRSKLRKGKWTVEEEEYTSRIIHYFISGLLTLPEGATLRSYLADKLNCDPMRITKKYAGASCLGRRVYHFRDRVHPTVGEIQVAKAELDHLEQRFRLRIEGRQSCMIWTPASGAAAPAAVPAEMVPSISQHAANGSTAGANVAGARSSQGNNNNNVLPTQLVTVNHSALQAQNLLQTLLLGMNGGNAPSKLAVAQSVAGLATQQQQPMFASPPLMGPGSTTNHTIPSMPPSVSQYLLPNGTQPGTESAQQSMVSPQMQGVDPNILSWAFSQAAASLGPALTHLAAANIQQAQLQQSQQQQAQLQQHAQLQQSQQQHQAQLQTQQLQAQQLLAQQKTQIQSHIREQQANVQRQLQHIQSQQQSFPAQAAPAPAMPTIAALPISLPAPPQAPPQVKSQTNDEQKTFAAELKQAFDRHMKSLEAIVPQANHSPDAKQTRVVDQVAEAVVLEQGFPSRSGQSTQSGHTRTDEDNEGGTALLGFLSSLRQSYENVLRDKQRFEGGKSESSYDTTSNRAANVTDSNSTQQRDSSVDDSDWNSDWNSDKKTDPSSSEDSDKEVNVRDKKTCSSRGPPRKRMKVKKVADEIRKGVCKLKSISLCSQSTLDTNK